MALPNSGTASSTVSQLLETFLIAARDPEFDPKSAYIGTPCRVEATTQHQVSHAQPRAHRPPAASGASSQMPGKMNTVATEHGDYCMVTAVTEHTTEHARFVADHTNAEWRNGAVQVLFAR